MIKVLKERKCLMCKHFFGNKEFLFEHKCKAYPDGIPNELLEEDMSHTDCKNKDYHFEKKAKRP